MAEAGLPGFEASSWFGVLAPAGTPPDIVAKLNGDVAKWLATPEAKEKMLAQGAIAVGGSPEDFVKHIAAENREVGEGGQGERREGRLTRPSVPAGHRNRALGDVLHAKLAQHGRSVPGRPAAPWRRQRASRTEGCNETTSPTHDTLVARRAAQRRSRCRPPPDTHRGRR